VVAKKTLKSELANHAAASFGRLSNIWKLYETLILSILLYSAELWPITVTAMKTLEAAHHRWLRKLLGITWKDKVKNEEVRRRTGLRKIEIIITERRLRWLGHVMRMGSERIPRQGMNWQIEGSKRKPGADPERTS
jgi:hypothetical protein